MTQCVGHPQLDEGLTRDADTTGFSINGAEQVYREVDVDALDLSARTTGLRQIQIWCQIASGIIGRQIGQSVELRSGNHGRFSGAAFSRQGTALFRCGARGGPR